MIIIYTTCKDKTEARKIAKALLDERLVACANIFPCTSLYRWEGRFCDESECAMLMKTRPAHWQKLQRRIKELHSYDLPCIERIEAKASREFEAWIQAETRHAG
jgi:periplasmic divalent cation tolerance protein